MNLQEDIDRIKEVMEQTSLELKGKTLAPKFAPPENFGQSKRAIDSKKPMGADFMVDAISAAIDVVPGFGNLISFVIDEIHALSYFVRAAMTSGLQRTEFIILGLVTALFGLYPVGGNIASVGVKQGIKNLLRMTPDSIQRWAIQKGIINYRILFDKREFKWSFWIFITKLMKTQGVEVLVQQVGKLKEQLIEVKIILQEKKLLTPELSEVFDTAISWLDTPSPEQLTVVKEMVNKGLI